MLTRDKVNEKLIEAGLPMVCRKRTVGKTEMNVIFNLSDKEEKEQLLVLGWEEKEWIEPLRAFISHEVA